jgi:hypothetical protein
MIRGVAKVAWGNAERPSRGQQSRFADRSIYCLKTFDLFFARRRSVRPMQIDASQSLILAKPTKR